MQVKLEGVSWKSATIVTLVRNASIASVHMTDNYELATYMLYIKIRC